MTRHSDTPLFAALLIGTLSPSPGLAFIVDGYWSGMSPQALVVVAATQGLSARPAGPGRWIVRTGVPPTVLATFGFCGNFLTSYQRDIRSDADYANTLANIFATYGPPLRMQFSGDVAPGTAAGRFVASGTTRWTLGTERVTMASDFDWRLAGGTLQRAQPASVRYETFSPCSLP